MPFLDSRVTLGGWDGGKYVYKLLNPMGRQLDCHVDGVDDAPQYEVQRSPGAVSFTELLERHRFLTDRVVGWEKWFEDAINGMQEGSAHLPTVVQVWMNGNGMLKL
jgi:hypothetical protein